jgi:hypothetical protein
LLPVFEEFMVKFKTGQIKKVRYFEVNKAREKLNSWSQSALTDHFFRASLIFWFFPLLLTIIYTLFSLNNLPNQVPLFYSHVWGEQQLAAKNYLLIPTVGSFLLGIFNFCLGISFHSKDKVSSYLLAGTATLVALLNCITVFNIINLIK